MSRMLEALLRDTRIEVRENEPIADHTTVHIGGPARWMAFPCNETELVALLAVVAEAGVPKALLGRGANLFADSQGFNGMVINLNRSIPEFHLNDGGMMIVNGGADMLRVAVEAARCGWCGIDFMACVPGTVGAAVAINAGTHQEGYIADRIEWVETRTFGGEKKRYTRDDMAFGYRTSRLLHGREIVVRAGFRLLACAEAGLTTQQVFERFKASKAIREEKFPLDLPNFGSAFRSPDPPIPPAGKLVDNLGLKGLRIGGAQVSHRHGNFIVNLGGAMSEDVLALMQRIHDAVLEHYGVSLQPEVHYLCNAGRPRPGFFPSA